MWACVIAVLAAAPLAACAWMLWVVYGSSRRGEKPRFEHSSSGASKAPDGLESFVLSALERLRDPGVELALRGRFEASRLLPTAQRQLVLLEIALDLDRSAPLPLAEADPMNDDERRKASSVSAPMRLLALGPGAREAFLAREIVEALRARLSKVLGHGPADRLLLRASELPRTLPEWRQFIDGGRLRAFVERLLEDGAKTLGAERLFTLLEMAARQVGAKLPLTCFERLLAEFPEEFLIAERSYAASRAALWQEFLTTRKKLDEVQDELSRSHALAAMTELSASMAHEINNPLASVLAILQMLGEEAPAGSKELTLLSAAESEARRIHRITSQLHELGTRTSSSQRVTKVRDLVEDAVGLIDRRAQAAGVRIERAIDSVPPLAVDGAHVRDALVHVMSSAVASMQPGGGTLTVTTRGDADGQVELVIRDTGPGVPAHVLRRLFEPEDLERVVEPWVEGAGSQRWVGLKAAHDIACSYHGELLIDGGEGRGSTFTFRFPAAPRKPLELSP